ncbi:MAG: 2-(1,2-epoxy-1,2-dihydrophenyl)acetyl-CoA isomerase [Nevskiaceae bacterium]|nr:MAG: 2-(1,2-epoxy-1,2-dihydrophenyl)acetyl-CoA isomerase [Nevskiaceae bacterium]TBR71475.1 MAG: 2-(1,2-epoxy-1,2-dihydrophenyl)acetyl-CoA isomerase [Nevskiaceae bacterium]
MTEVVLYSLHEGVATLTLNRPEKMNSLSLPTVEALSAGALRAVAEGAGALVITGTGRAFCAGADLSGTRGMAGPDGVVDLGAPMRSHYNPLVQTLTTLEIPVVAAVNGIAAGGGMSLALCADCVVAARSATFRCLFIDIHLIPDMGATWLLERLAGRARARGMALLGEGVDAATACDWGLIWQVVDDAALSEAATAIARRLAGKSRTALQATRYALDAGAGATLAAQLDYEARVQAELGRDPEFLQVIARFRKPDKSAPSGN